MTTNIQTHAQTRERNATKAHPKWQDWSILMLGGILFITPWVFGTASQILSSWNAWIVGIGLGVFTGRTLLPPPGGYAVKCAHEGISIAWWQRVLDTCKLSHIAKEQIVVGAWMIVAPWILGFAALGAAAWPAWIAGIVIVILAVWKLRELRGE